MGLKRDIKKSSARSVNTRKTEDGRNVFYNILNKQNEAFLLIDKNTNIIIWNDSLEKISGIKKNLVIGKSIDNFIQLINLKKYFYLKRKVTNKIKKIIIHALEKGKSEWNNKEIEYKIAISNKNSKILKIKCILINDKDNSYFGFIVSDITLEKRYRMVLEAVNNSIISLESVIDIEGIFKTVAHELKKLDLFSVFMPYDSETKELRIGHVSFESKNLMKIKKILNLSRETFKIKISKIKELKNALRNKKTIYIKNPKIILNQIFPHKHSIYTNKIISILDLERIIMTPIIIEKLFVGFFVVSSKTLKKEDISIIESFGKQISTILHRNIIIDNYKKEITRSREIEKVLQENHKRMQNYLDIAGVMIIILTKHGRIELINKKGCEILEGREKDLIGMDWFNNFILISDRKIVKNVFNKIMGGDISNLEYYENDIITKKNKIKTMAWHNNIIKDNNNNITGIISSGEDITKRKTDEKKLFESESKFRSIAEKSAVGIYLIQDYIFKYINPRLARILGYTPEEVIYKITPKEITHPDDWKFIDKKIKMRLEGKIDFVHHTLRAYKKNGDIVQGEIYGARTIYNGKPAVIGTFLDITEITKLRDQLIQTEKLSAVGQIASGVAHEFNNILAIIRGNAQLALSDVDNPVEITSALKIIDEQTNRGEKIVSDLNMFARSKVQDLKIVDISDVINRSITMLKKQFSLQNIQFKYSTKAKLYAKLDTGQFQQVFLNLFINARDAILPKEKGIIYVETEQYNGSILITVKDNGIGMDDDDKDNIFLPFFTTKGARANKNLGIKGTGLGLSVTHRIISQHNGSINVESKKESGTVFTIIIPRESKKGRAKLVREFSHIKKGINQFKDVRLLIIDDEVQFTNILTRTLKKEGFANIKVYNSSLNALAEFERGKHDVVLLDLMMPGIGGETVINRIKKTDPKCQIIVLTGQFDIEKEDLKNIGAKSIIFKPFKISKILFKITEAIK